MNNDTKDGTKGFSPQLSGNGKVGNFGSSSFNINTKEEPLPPSDTPSGHEEGGRMRQPKTSSVVRKN